MTLDVLYQYVSLCQALLLFTRWPRPPTRPPSTYQPPSSLLADAFLVGSRNTFIKHEQFQLMQTTSNSNISIEKYQHKTFNLTYLYKKASPGRENDRPLLLIHPIGVGLSSWFYIKVLESYKNNPAIYAPDLIGCGINHGKFRIMIVVYGS